jgi:hypothetical protein
LEVNLPSELIPTDSDILIWLTTEEKEKTDKPDNTDSSTETLGKMNEEEELRERFNDDYLTSNYGKVSIAKLEAKALARKVIIESCIRTQGENGQRGHIIQNDHDLNAEVRRQ